jgi:hypothetical protein
MISRRVLKKFANFFGLTADHWLVRLIPWERVVPNIVPGQEHTALIGKIGADPLNPSLHMELAIQASGFGNHFLAYSELKTAAFLGLDSKEIEKYEGIYKSALPENLAMNHNTYFRMKSLTDEILKRSNGKDCSVLDVGGGTGALASFIPEHQYCLVEPTQNGISGTNLPFTDRSFDIVVSCHVLEHIAPEERELFLDQLLSKASTGLILLNPFEVPKTLVTERLQLTIDITGADWAQEHLDCSLPRIEDLQAYATERGLNIQIYPNGTMTTTLAFVFMDYFSDRSRVRADIAKINSFFNKNYQNILDSETFPNAYCVFIESPGSTARQ